MKKWYYFNKNTDVHGKHEVHTEDCVFIPDYSNRELIGSYYSCEEAIKRAEEDHLFKKFDGCYYCCYSCHKG